MAKKKNLEINLLPQKEFEGSTFGRLLKWLVSTFRYIVIITEMVVMGAFLSRFYLDAKSGDLTDAITQKTAIIASYSTFEKQFRSTQNKLVSFKNFSGTGSRLSPVIDDISSKTPTDVIITDLTVDGQKIDITSQSINENSAANFLNSLTSSTFLTNPSLTSISKKTGVSEISFTISALLKERTTSTNGN